MAKKKWLTAAERSLLQQLSVLDSLDAKRAEALLALDRGETYAAAGEQAGLTQGQVTYIVTRFRKQRLEGFSLPEQPAEEVSVTDVEEEAILEAAAEAPEPAREPDVELSAADDKFSRILQDLNRRAQALQTQVPDYVPPAFSPQRFLKLLRTSADRFTPAVIKDVRENLQDATAEDFKDPDTWKGIWFLLTYSLREESKTLFDKATDRAAGLPVVGRGVQAGRDALSAMPSVGESVEKGKELLSKMPGAEQGKKILASMPGAGLVSDLSSMLEGATPQDFLDKDTWSGMWYVINHSLQHEAEELRKRVRGSAAEAEEEVIEIDSD